MLDKLCQVCRAFRIADDLVSYEELNPVLTWILGYLWSLPRGFRRRFEWGHERAFSSNAVVAVSRFCLRGPRDL